MQQWFSSALIILLQITLKISLSFVHIFMTGKLTQLVPQIYLFAIFQKSTEEQNCGTRQAVILSLKNVPRNLSAHLLSCSKVHIIVLYFYSSDIYIYLAVTIVLYSLIFVLFLLIICIAAEKPIQGASIKICTCDYLY